jgi:hypothetical protein
MAFINARLIGSPSAAERDDLKHPAQYEELQYEQQAKHPPMDAQLTRKRIHHAGEFSDVRFRGEVFVPALNASETFFRCRYWQPSCPLYAIE